MLFDREKKNIQWANNPVYFKNNDVNVATNLSKLIECFDALIDTVVVTWQDDIGNILKLINKSASKVYSLEYNSTLIESGCNYDEMYVFAKGFARAKGF